jgi:hypothetical protein
VVWDDLFAGDGPVAPCVETAHLAVQAAEGPTSIRSPQSPNDRRRRNVGVPDLHAASAMHGLLEWPTFPQGEATLTSWLRDAPLAL